MENKDKIVEILKKHEGWVDRSMTNTCLWPDDYKAAAEEIVKVFAIPVVVVSDVVTEVCEHKETYEKVRFGVTLTKCVECREILKQTILRVINCSTCKHKDVSKYVEPCHTCMKLNGYPGHESAIV